MSSVILMLTDANSAARYRNTYLNRINVICKYENTEDTVQKLELLHS